MCKNKNTYNFTKGGFGPHKLTELTDCMEVMKYTSGTALKQ